MKNFYDFVEKNKPKISYAEFMEKVKNPKPLKKPPYSCSLTCYGEAKKCIYPNCFCEWKL